MRAIAVHEDVVVAVGAIWKTSCTAVRAEGGSGVWTSGGAGGGEALLIDSPILPEELEALPGVLERAGFAVGGLFATHADWDHLLGGYAFPEAPLACAESTAARLAADPEEAAGELREFDEQYLIDRPGPLAPVVARELAAPGRLPLPPGGGAAGGGAVGSPPGDAAPGSPPGGGAPGSAPGEAAPGSPPGGGAPGFPPGSVPGEGALELVPADGHTADGAAVWVPWARVLVCGDYLSPRAIPELSPSSSLDAYLATLRRLEPLVERAAAVVPGHGEPLDRERAAAVLREDAAYVEALAEALAGSGPRPRPGAGPSLDPASISLPPGRDDGGNRALHEHNVGLAS